MDERTKREAQQLLWDIADTSDATIQDFVQLLRHIDRNAIRQFFFQFELRLPGIYCSKSLQHTRVECAIFTGSAGPFQDLTDAQFPAPLQLPFCSICQPALPEIHFREHLIHQIYDFIRRFPNQQETPLLDSISPVRPLEELFQVAATSGINQSLHEEILSALAACCSAPNRQLELLPPGIYFTEFIHHIHPECGVLFVNQEALIDFSHKPKPQLRKLFARCTPCSHCSNPLEQYQSYLQSDAAFDLFRKQAGRVKPAIYDDFRLTPKSIQQHDWLPGESVAERKRRRKSLKIRNLPHVKEKFSESRRRRSLARKGRAANMFATLNDDTRDVFVEKRRNEELRASSAIIELSEVSPYQTWRTELHAHWGNCRVARGVFKLGSSFTFLDMLDYIGKTCYWCGKTLPFPHFDRWNNATGYHRSNVIVTCKWCNWMRNANTPKEFVANCFAVSTYQTSGVAATDAKRRKTLTSYGAWKRGVERDGKIVTLDEITWRTLKLSRCTYCGVEKANGIDRVDATSGYTIENSTACCQRCNTLKWHLPFSKFLKRVHIISKHRLDLQDYPEIIQ